jgi:hypothetical protein
MENKLVELRKYSNPEIVVQRAIKLYGKNVDIRVSSRKNKKYMIYDPKKRQFIHFGSFNPPMEDYTKHGDEIRRMKFQIRNNRFASANKYSPAFNTYYLLW